MSVSMSCISVIYCTSFCINSGKRIKIVESARKIRCGLFAVLELGVGLALVGHGGAVDLVGAAQEQIL